MAKARKKRSGSLEKRGGVWLARWMVDGKRFTRSTGESDKRKALSKLDEFTTPYRLKDERRILEVQAARLQGINTELRQVEDALPALRFMEAWNVYRLSQSRPRSGAATLRLYEQKYFIFVEWMKTRHPEITELRQVSREIAEEYANELLNGTARDEAAAKKLSQKWLVNFYRNRRARKCADPLTDEEQRLVAIHRQRNAQKILSPLRGSTFNMHVNTLALVWRHVAQHKDAKIKFNPWSFNRDTGEGIRRIALKKSERQHTRRALTLEEVYNLLKTATGEMRLLIAFGFYTGLRLGDICNLTWGSIDRVSGVMTVRSKKTDVETKTFLHPALVRMIEAEATAHTGFILPTLHEQYAHSVGQVSHAVEVLFRSVGIQTQTVETDGRRARPDATFHSLRHTFVSTLRNRGIALHAAQALAGHSSAAMTEHYTHEDGRATLALPDVMDAAARSGAVTVAALPDNSTAQARRFTVEDLRGAVATWTDEERAEALRIVGGDK